MRRFELRQGTSSKFWEIAVEGLAVTVRFGRIGAQGQQKTKSLRTPEAARGEHDRLVAEKLRKGYVEQGRGPRSGPTRPPPTPATEDLVRKVVRLNACLKGVRYRDGAGSSARQALEILEGVDAETRALVQRECAEQGTDRDELMARCHVALGKEAFLSAERDYWQGPLPEDHPYLSCRINSEEAYFEPASEAMAKTRRRPGTRARRDDGYAPAVRHLERAIELFPDPWHRLTPRNLRLAGELRCDPCLPPFYLGVIALRRDDPAGARARLEGVREAADIRAGQPGAMGRGQVRVAAAVLVSVAELLQGRLDEAARAMKRAVGLDRDNLAVVRNQGYLHERRGEPDEAAACYRKVLEWEPKDGYALRRLPLAEVQAGRTPAPIIELRRPRDFHSKFPQIAQALRTVHGHTKAPRPVPEATLDEIRLARRRVGGQSDAVALPESVKTILRHDRGFALEADGAALLGSVVATLRARSPGPRVVPSVDIDRLVRTQGCLHHLPALKKLPASIPVWNEDPELPACIALHHRGEQWLFLYVGEPDADGEYPVARLEDEELWVEEASLIHLVVSESINAGVRIECAFDLETLAKKARKRNALHDERLSDHPRVQAIAESPGSEAGEHRR